MSLTIRAHFDGQVIVPDEPVDLPVDQPLEVELRHTSSSERLDGEKRQAALERLASRAIKGLSISDESLRREHLYEDLS